MSGENNSYPMNKKSLLRQALLVFPLMVGALTAVGLFSSVAMAAATDSFGTAAPSAVLEGTGGQTSLKGLILTVVNYFLGFLGLLAVIMIIYGGVQYVISAGQDEAIGNAKKIIMYSLIGLIVILLSFVLVRAVLGAGGGVVEG